MAVPTATVRIDWDADGAFTGGYDDVTSRVRSEGLSWTRGRSADFSAEATGAASFTLRNDDDRFTPDRNWCDNPSFEKGTAGWSAASTPLTGPATSISQVTDTATAATGSKAGEAVLPELAFQADTFQYDTFPGGGGGVSYAIPYSFRSGVTYSASVYLKSVSGVLTVRAGLASAGTPTDIASSSGNITTSWAAYTVTWTPSADRSDAVFFVRTTTAAAATVRIDGVQVNPGAAANAYIEAPTKGQLVPGKPVHIMGTYSATDYALFYGYIERLQPDPRNRVVTVTCYDVLRRLSEVDTSLPVTALTSRTAFDCRTELLTDFERGDHNLLQNPSFETDLSAWTLVAGGGDTLTRITTDAAPAAGGTCCAEMVTATALSYLQGAAQLVPVFFAGQTYRASVYLRATAGTPTVTVGLGRSHTTYLATRTYTLSTSWARYTVTWTVDTETAAAAAGLLLFVEFPTGTGTVRIDGAAVTRGQALLPYADTGSGRWPNYCGTGSFDGGGLNGWYGGWTNLCGNGGFETDATGWAVTADSFHAAATSITRTTAEHHRGAASAVVAHTDFSAVGCHYAVSGTFQWGVTYRLFFYFKQALSPRAMTYGIGSNGTPTDYASGTDTGNTSWEAKYVDWTPSADRADVHIYMESAYLSSSYLYIDDVMIYERSSEWVMGDNPAYVDAGPAGMTVGTMAKGTSTTAKYGALSHSFDTRATVGSGRIYDFVHLGSYFVAGRSYTASCWVRSSDASAPVKIGLAATSGTTWDEATATGTANNSGWTQLTVTWTPAANFPDAGATSAMRRVFTICQTDATARTLYIDGVRIIPGSSADGWTMAHWDLDTAETTDRVSSSATFSDSALANLSTINALTLTRHYITPELTTPFYTYVTSDRDAYVVKASAETYDDDLADMSSAEIDRASIINIVPIVYSPNAPTTEFYSDETSVARYGPRPGSALSGSTFYSTRATPDIVGPALIARHKDPRARPAITVANRFPSQLQRELDDLVTVNFALLGIVSGKYLIQSLTTSVSAGGLVWRTTYQLEEYPY